MPKKQSKQSAVTAANIEKLAEIFPPYRESQELLLPR